MGVRKLLTYCRKHPASTSHSLSLGAGANIKLVFDGLPFCFWVCNHAFDTGSDSVMATGGNFWKIKERTEQVIRVLREKMGIEPIFAFDAAKNVTENSDIISVWIARSKQMRQDDVKLKGFCGHKTDEVPTIMKMGLINEQVTTVLKRCTLNCDPTSLSDLFRQREGSIGVSKR